MELISAPSLLIDTEVKARTLLSPAKMSFQLTSPSLQSVQEWRGSSLFPVNHFVSFLLEQTKCYLTGDLGAVSSTQKTQGREPCC